VEKKPFWKDIPGYEGLYQISRRGQVKSLGRKIIDNRCRVTVRKDMIKINQVDMFGYYRIQLKKDGISKNFRIHRLIALAFIPNPSNKKCINHIDANKKNNRISNLEWCTNKENIQHAFRKSLVSRARGENCANATISDTQAEQVASLLWKGWRTYDIAKKIGCSPQVVSKIKTGRTRTFLNIPPYKRKEVIQISKETQFKIASKYIDGQKQAGNQKGTYTAKEIAEEFGVRKWVVTKAVGEYRKKLAAKGNKK
jgi:hypothetical protein